MKKPVAEKSSAGELHPAAWALGGAVLVMLGVVVTASLLPRGPTGVANTPPGMPAVQPHRQAGPNGASPVSINDPAVANSDVTDEKAPSKPATAALTPTQLAAAVHLVLV